MELAEGPRLLSWVRMVRNNMASNPSAGRVRGHSSLDSVLIHADHRPSRGFQAGVDSVLVALDDLPGSWGCGGTCGCVRDRKSTRLNSSHLGISYAVFCLKKKRKNLTKTQR